MTQDDIIKILTRVHKEVTALLKEGYEMKEYDIINKILINLTDAIGWTGKGKQMEAFLDARDKLLALVDNIDNSDDLDKAKDHIMFLLPMAKGYAYPTHIKANLEMIENAEEFIKQMKLD